MNRYRIKVINEFNLDAKNKQEVYEQVNTIIYGSNILNLPIVKKDVIVKIKKIKVFFFRNNSRKKFKKQKK
ncbi:MAG: hypothetical protein E7166_05525 [Firmicutes bacterium]|nr:hypothetical protein [Bacillota bacterium]